MRKPYLLPSANQPDSKYPDGSYKGSSTPEARDGTPIRADYANDTIGFYAALLHEVKQRANGIGEGVGSSQLVDAIKKMISTAKGQCCALMLNKIEEMQKKLELGLESAIKKSMQHTDNEIVKHKELINDFSAKQRHGLHMELDNKIIAHNKESLQKFEALEKMIADNKTDLSDYKKLIDSRNYATKSYVLGKGYATQSFVKNQGYATQSFVKNQGYASSKSVTFNARRIGLINQMKFCTDGSASVGSYSYIQKKSNGRYQCTTRRTSNSYSGTYKCVGVGTHGSLHMKIS